MKILLIGIIWMIIIAAAIFLLLALIGGTDIHFHRKARNGKIRIACVGDSITNGALVPNCFRHCYPSQLQRMLGNGYHVENYGLNDRTLQMTGQKPYRREREYLLSLAFAPDLAVIILGSNDTKPVNWISQEDFAAEYRVLLDSYLQPEKKPRIILCTPPWALAPEKAIQSITNDADPSRLPEISETVKQIGAEYHLPVIDLYSLFEGKKELLGPDNLHPNSKGDQLIAEQVYRVIRN